MAKSKPPIETITSEIFEHLVLLAAFELESEEGDYLRAELNAQLGAIRELEAIKVEDDVDITSHGVPYAPAITPALRADEVLECLEADEIVAGSPHNQDRYIIVPDIPHEELK